MNGLASNAVFVWLAAFAGLLALLGAGIALHSRLKLKKLKKSAFLDSVTGGLSENGFQESGGKILSGKSSQFAMVSMRVKNLPQICRIQGTEAGGQALRYLHGVLKTQLGGDALVAKTGEDTFCFLLKNRKTDEICGKLDCICDAANRYYEKEPGAQALQLVFGIYLPKADGEGLREMQTNAVLARVNGPADRRYRFYEQDRMEKADWEREMAASLDRAQQMGELVVYFQPKVRLSDCRIVGAEALIRWRHPQRGMLSPDMFLPVAESYQKLAQIDDFVFEYVCRALARWQKWNWELCPISVNLCRANIARPDFAEACYQTCTRYHVPPAQIEFEMKEAFLLENLEQASFLLEQLHRYGFRCSLDNFGADYCSMQLLTSLEIDTIKLDRSFFAGENNSRRGRYIVETLLKLAAQLHIPTVAEGIDNQGQVRYLQQAACDMIQGFCYFKPMPLEKFEHEVYADSALKYVETGGDGLTEQDRKRSAAPAPAAQSSKSIVLFSYLPEEDSVEFSDVFSPVLGNQKRFENALALFRTTDLIHENDREDFFRLLDRCRRESGWVENTLRFYLSEGRYEWLELRMHQEDGKNGGVISGTMVNVAGWKNEVSRWKEKATRDALTGLYNREYFEQSVTAMLKQGGLTTAAILFIDVDDFKRVNDTFGHMFGDGVLCYVAKQLLSVFRHTDIIARYGGDEFVVFAPSIEAGVLEDRLKRLCATFQYPYRSDTVEYKVSGSIGAAMYPRDGSDYQTLLDNADCALYEAKNRGKNQYMLYEPYMEGESGAD